jgi:hypothetical protein
VVEGENLCDRFLSKECLLYNTSRPYKFCPSGGSRLCIYYWIPLLNYLKPYYPWHQIGIRDVLPLVDSPSSLFWTKIMSPDRPKSCPRKKSARKQDSSTQVRSNYFLSRNGFNTTPYCKIRILVTTARVTVKCASKLPPNGQATPPDPPGASHVRARYLHRPVSTQHL